MNHTANNIIDHTKALLEQARSGYHRECIVFSGEEDWCIDTVNRISETLDLSSSICVAAEEIAISLATYSPMEKAVNYLGQEFSHAVINCHEGIDPNVLGAIAGTVRGGGLFILLVPDINKLSEFDDPEKKRMTIWPCQTSDISNRFLVRFANIIKQSEITSLFAPNEERPGQLSSEPKPIPESEYLQNDRCITMEQRNTVEAVLHVIDGHRKRPLVITADRGRGKSSALGIAAADLLKRGGHNIIATAPRFNAAEKIFEHAATQVMGAVKNNEIIYKDSSLRFMPVDAIVKEHPDCSLLLVDEAAAIPVNLLTKLLTLYSRIVFATTTYGYEGTGRGFNLRFFEILNKTVPGWKHEEIKTPVRWSTQDPLENFINQLLCLNADIARIPENINYSKVSIQSVDRDSLVDNQEQLSQIFGLLVLAHYKTQPRDLRYLLDSQDLSIFIASCDDKIIGAAIVELEGGLDPEMSQLVYRNERRVHGHLLPQSLESTIGIKNASQLRYMRVIRIIVHPSCQRHGIGEKLLSSIENFAVENSVDLVGAVFGIHNDILPFWQDSEYAPVHVGLASNTSTGTHSIGVLKPVSMAGEQLFRQAKSLFYSRLGFLLTTVYSDLEPDLIEYLYSLNGSEHGLSLDQQQIEDVVRFAHASSDYDMAAQSIRTFVQICFYEKNVRETLSKTEKNLLIKKVLQQHNWPLVIDALKIEGRSKAIQLLRQTIAKLEKLLL